MTNRYPFNIEWSDEDQEYVATCHDFPGLSAFGKSEDEALREAKIALEGFIQVSIDRNIPLPEPTVRQTFSGKLQLRLEKSLHRLASQRAREEEVSLNTYIVDAVQAKVSGELMGKRILEEILMATARPTISKPSASRR